MASPSTVLTLGFGSWGSVNLLPTLGYGASAAIDAPAEVTLIAGAITRTLTAPAVGRTLIAPAITRTLTCPDPE